MNKVQIWCHAHYDEKNFYVGNSFENALLEELEHTKKTYPNDKSFKFLFEELERLKGKKHPEDTLWDVFYNDVIIDFEFAKQLKLYDIIDSYCFSSRNNKGKALIELINTADFRFILYRRSWSGTNEIELDFEVSHVDKHLEIWQKFIKHEQSL